MSTNNEQLSTAAKLLSDAGIKFSQAVLDRAIELGSAIDPDFSQPVQLTGPVFDDRHAREAISAAVKAQYDFDPQPGYGYSGSSGRAIYPSAPMPLYKVLGVGEQHYQANYSTTKPWSLPTESGPGEWYEIEGTVVECRNGLHLSDVERLSYWASGGGDIYETEVDGPVLFTGDKWVARRVRLVRKLGTLPPDWLNDCARRYWEPIRKNMLAHVDGWGADIKADLEATQSVNEWDAVIERQKKRLRAEKLLAEVAGTNTSDSDRDYRNAVKELNRRLSSKGNIRYSVGPTERLEYIRDLLGVTDEETTKTRRPRRDAEAA